MSVKGKRSGRVVVDINILQTVPPSCLNRDDTGRPKTATYGGAQRARVSSQAWKKATRDMFNSEIGTRTKRVSYLIADKMMDLGCGLSYDEAEAKARLVYGAAFESKEKDIGTTFSRKSEDSDWEVGALMFLSESQVKKLAELAISGELERIMNEKGEPDYKERSRVVEGILKRDISTDIALFGRMVASNSQVSIDASCQVAHALSTHKVSVESDYFTAIDEYSAEGKTDAGAAMIGNVDFDSATLYRYATVAVHELHRQLGGEKIDTAKAVVEFVKAFTLSMPTGKLNSFGNGTVPGYIQVVVRDDRGVNLVDAFEKPIKWSEGSGYFEKSVEALESKSKAASNWVNAPVWESVVSDKQGTLSGLLGDVMEQIKEML